MNGRIVFAYALRTLMDKNHLTQKDLASAIGLTSSAVSLYCTGKAYPECSVLIKIASYFGVSTDYLLTGIEPEMKSAAQSLGISENAAESLHNAVRGDYGDISPVLEFLLKSKEFYTNLEYCVQGFLSDSPRAAILMCSNGMMQVINAEVKVGKDAPSQTSDN